MLIIPKREIAIMSTTYYTSDHEWITIENNIATIGITDHAQQALGEIVFVELPPVGEECEKGSAIAVVESVKSASDVYAPIEGKITAINADLEDSPEKVNESAEENGWFFKIQFDNELSLDGLMTQEDYLKTLDE